MPLAGPVSLESATPARAVLRGPLSLRAPRARVKTGLPRGAGLPLAASRLLASPELGTPVTVSTALLLLLPTRSVLALSTALRLPLGRGLSWDGTGAWPSRPRPRKRRALTRPSSRRGPTSSVRWGGLVRTLFIVSVHVCLSVCEGQCVWAGVGRERFWRPPGGGELAGSGTLLCQRQGSPRDLPTLCHCHLCGQ